MLDDGRPASAHSVTLMAERGLDLSGHVSRQLTTEMLEAADLFVGMERRHVREIAVAVPDAFPRTFTLKELVRRATAAGPRPDGVSVADWLASLVEGRTTADQLGDVAADDIADPIGRTLQRVPEVRHPARRADRGRRRPPRARCPVRVHPRPQEHHP